MMLIPAINPDVDDIADRAKYGYARASQLLAEMQYRLAELAGAGRLDRDESIQLQIGLFRIYEEVYAGTLCAVRDWDTDDSTWDEDDNHYSDGREVIVRARIEPEEAARAQWPGAGGFLLGDGAVNEFPRGTIAVIEPHGRVRG